MLSPIHKLDNDINLSWDLLSSSEKDDHQYHLIDKSSSVNEKDDDKSQSDFYN